MSTQRRKDHLRQLLVRKNMASSTHPLNTKSKSGRDSAIRLDNEGCDAVNSRRVFKHTSALVVLMPQITSRGKAVPLGIKLEASFFSPHGDCYSKTDPLSEKSHTKDNKPSKAKGQARVKLKITTLTERKDFSFGEVAALGLCCTNCCVATEYVRAEVLMAMLGNSLSSFGSNLTTNSTVPGTRVTGCAVELLETFLAFSCCYDRTCE